MSLYAAIDLHSTNSVLVVQILVGADRRAGNRCPPALVGAVTGMLSLTTRARRQLLDQSTDNMSRTGNR
jgi:hypothetical protein